MTIKRDNLDYNNDGKSSPIETVCEACSERQKALEYLTQEEIKDGILPNDVKGTVSRFGEKRLLEDKKSSVIEESHRLFNHKTAKGQDSKWKYRFGIFFAITVVMCGIAYSQMQLEYDKLDEKLWDCKMSLQNTMDQVIKYKAIYKEMLSNLVIPKIPPYLLNTPGGDIILHCPQMSFDNNRSDSQSVYIDSENQHVSKYMEPIDNNSTHQILSATEPLMSIGFPQYYEVWTDIEQDVPKSQEQDILLFETGLCPENMASVDSNYKSKDKCCSVQVSYCKDYASPCYKSIAGDWRPLSSKRVSYDIFGIIYDDVRRRIIFKYQKTNINICRDVNTNQIMWPIFWVYGSKFASLKFGLRSGKQIHMFDWKKEDISLVFSKPDT